MAEDNNSGLNLEQEITHFILFGLPKWDDPAIFSFLSFRDLGQAYYCQIQSQVQNATPESINGAIERLQSNDGNYYDQLISIVGIKHLPHDKLEEVRRQFDQVMIGDYDALKMKYQAAISQINTALLQNKAQIEAIENQAPVYSFTHDIISDEKRLDELHLECTRLRTQKESLSYSMHFADLALSGYCDLDDPVEIDMANRKTALKLCFDDNGNAERDFSWYRSCVETAQDDIERPYGLFYKVKFYIALEKCRQKYYRLSFIKAEEEALEQYKIDIDKIPQIDVLHDLKNNDISRYNQTLDKLITDFDLVSDLKLLLEETVCLRMRKGILQKSVDLYEEKEFDLFISLISIQIEGMFADFLRDTTVFRRFSKMTMYYNDVLKDKIQHLQDVGDTIYPEAVEYFGYYYNNLIRNRIAHGNYHDKLLENAPLKEAFSKELFLDFVFLTYMLSRKSETEKMYRYVQSYIHYPSTPLQRTSVPPYFGALFNDIIGKRTHFDYDTVEKYRPIQVVYWLVNPYYERIYGSVANKDELLTLRDSFLDKPFWKYVSEQLESVLLTGYDYLRIDSEFSAIIHGLFSCVKPEVKPILAKINAKLTEIQNFPAD